jgi:hypothetical protein
MTEFVFSVTLAAATLANFTGFGLELGLGLGLRLGLTVFPPALLAVLAMALGVILDVALVSPAAFSDCVLKHSSVPATNTITDANTSNGVFGLLTDRGCSIAGRASSTPTADFTSNTAISTLVTPSTLFFPIWSYTSYIIKATLIRATLNPP